MDAVAEQKSKEIQDIAGPTMNAFTNLLNKKKSEIENVPKKTFKYGTTNRHQLDVYYPSPTSTPSKPPILFFSYGGGLYVGSRTLPRTNSLIYANLGAFFASHGYLTVIADYRLIPHGAKHPDPVDDVRDALTWVVANLGEEGDLQRLFLMGHSAGAMIQATMLLLLQPQASLISDKIRGVIWNGGVYGLDLSWSMPPGFVADYFGTDENAAGNTPLSLLKTFSDIGNFPPTLLLAAEHEPSYIYAETHAFEAALKEKGPGVEVEKWELKGHNHLSSNAALFSGDEKGEEWGLRVLEWMGTLNR